MVQPTKQNKIKTHVKYHHQKKNPQKAPQNAKKKTKKNQTKEKRSGTETPKLTSKVIRFNANNHHRTMGDI
jgi:hypothetical protein